MSEVKRCPYYDITYFQTTKCGVCNTYHGAEGTIPFSALNIYKEQEMEEDRYMQYQNSHQTRAKENTQKKDQSTLKTEKTEIKIVCCSIL